MIIIVGLESLEGYGKYIFDEFEFESGQVLKDVEVEYQLSGTPKYDDEGKIINAIVYCHGFNGNCSSINDFIIFARKWGIFKNEDYFFISITTLGVPQSCSPSSTGLNHRFPKYIIKDRVNFKRKFLKEKLNVDRVLGLLGHGVGGYECYTWACEYPDEMEFLMVSTSAFKISGYKYVVSKGFESIIEHCDGFYDDLYSDSLSKIMVSINIILYSNFFSKRIFEGMTNDELDVLLDDFVDEGLFVDIYDFKFRNDATLEYDLEDKLGNIKAKSLIISPSEDVYFTPIYDTLPLKNLIKDSKIILIEARKDYRDNNHYSSVVDDVNYFLEEFKK